MKYVFCDIDGVLNSYEGSKESSIVSIELDKVLLLKELVTATNSKLVINSKASWLSDVYKSRIDTIESTGLHVDDQIVRTLITYNPKAIDVLAYLNRQDDVENVLILDDTDDDYSEYFKYNFILVDSKVGLTKQNIKDGIDILGQ